MKTLLKTEEDRGLSPKITAASKTDNPDKETIMPEPTYTQSYYVTFWDHTRQVTCIVSTQNDGQVDLNVDEIPGLINELGNRYAEANSADALTP